MPADPVGEGVSTVGFTKELIGMLIVVEVVKNTLVIVAVAVIHVVLADMERLLVATLVLGAILGPSTMVAGLSKEDDV